MAGKIQLHINLTERQAELLRKAKEVGAIDSTSEGIRRAVNDFIDGLIAKGKIKEG